MLPKNKPSKYPSLCRERQGILPDMLMIILPPIISKQKRNFRKFGLNYLKTKKLQVMTHLLVENKPQLILSVMQIITLLSIIF